MRTLLLFVSFLLFSTTLVAFEGHPYNWPGHHRLEKVLAHEYQEELKFEQCIDQCFKDYQVCLVKEQYACDRKLSYCSDGCRRYR